MRTALIVCLAVSATAAQGADTVRIGVLKLFRPAVVEVRAPGAGALTLVGCGERLKIEGGRIAALRVEHGRLAVDAGADGFLCGSLSSASADAVELTIPGKITRRYEGRLEASVSGEILGLAVEMPRAAALAAIVAAETGPGWSGAALAAQAVVSRSYLEAGGRHQGFDFCDSTHCQYLGDPPDVSSPVWDAVKETSGVTLRYRGKPIQALFTRSCCGRTAPAGAGSGYSFKSVQCPACSRRPVRWSRNFPSSFAPNLRAARVEAGRIPFVRRHGWDALPSSAFETSAGDERIVVQGVGEGHGIGLCQRGAAEMARGGADWQAILAHYFPNAAIE